MAPVAEHRLDLCCYSWLQVLAAHRRLVTSDERDNLEGNEGAFVLDSESKRR